MAALAALVLAGCAATDAGDEAAAPVLTAQTVEIEPAAPADPGPDGVAPLVAPAPGGVLRAALAGDIDCWNGLSAAPAAWTVFAFAARGLYGYAPTATGAAADRVVPALADDLPLVSEDGLAWRVRLRDGLRFPDGSAVDAGDVIATFERMLDPAAQCASGGPPASGAYAALAGYPDWAAARAAGDDAGPLPGVSAVDRLTVEFALAEPDPSFAHALALPWAFIRPADAPAAGPDDGPPPFVGPYRVTLVERGRRVVLEREPGWAANVLAGAPAAPGADALDGMAVTIGVPPARQLAALEAGSLDLSLDPGLPHGADVGRIARAAAYAGRVHSTPAAAVLHLALRADQPPFDRVEARRAVNLAVDRAALARIAGGPLAGAPWAQLVPPGLAGDQPPDLYAHDPARARALVGATGAVGEAVVLAHGAGPAGQALARQLRRDLARIGLDVRLRALPAAAYAGFLREPGAPWHLALVDATAYAPDAAAWYGPLLGCGAPANLGRWCDEAFDERVREAAALPAGAERDAQLAALSTVAMEEQAPWAPLLAPRRFALVSGRLLNYRWAPVPGPLLGLAGVEGPASADAPEPG
jgi:peptide/nickel transport system substrate-binding protein